MVQSFHLERLWKKIYPESFTTSPPVTKLLICFSPRSSTAAAADLPWEVDWNVHKNLLRQKDLPEMKLLKESSFGNLYISATFRGWSSLRIQFKMKRKLFAHVISKVLIKGQTTKVQCRNKSHAMTLLQLYSHSSFPQGLGWGSPCVQQWKILELSQLVKLCYGEALLSRKDHWCLPTKGEIYHPGYLPKQSDTWHDETAEVVLWRKPELFLLNATKSFIMMIMWLWHSSERVRFDNIPSQTVHCKTIRLGQRVVWLSRQKTWVC